MEEIEMEENELQRARISDIENKPFARIFRPLSNRTAFISSHQLTFLSVAFNMGLGNFSGYPLILANNGGGAFILPYIITMTILGKSIVYLEMSLGQFSGRSCIKLHKNLSPAFIGFGICQLLICLNHLVNYSYLTSILLGYMTYSLHITKRLPWTVSANETVHKNSTEKFNRFDLETKSAVVFLYKKLLNTATAYEEGMGFPNKTVIGYLIIIWIVVIIISLAGKKVRIYFSYFCILLGLSSSSFMILYAMPLPGVTKGMMHILFADWKYLIKLSSWANAFEQCVFSLGVGSGVMTNYASFTKIGPDLQTAALILVFSSFFWNTLVAVQLFGGLGQTAFRFNLPIEDVIPTSKFELYSVRYIDAISNYGLSPHLLCFIFSATMFVTSLATMIGYTYTIVTNFVDIFKGFYIVTLISVCAVCTIFSLFYATKFGIFLSQIVYEFGVETCAQLVVFCQLAGISYLYGLQDWCWDIEFMTKAPPTLTQRFIWAILLPIMFLAVGVPVFISEVEKHSITANLNRFKKFASSLMITTMCPIPLGFIIAFCKSFKKTESMFECMFSKKYWLPACFEDAERYERFVLVKQKQSLSVSSRWRRLVVALKLNNIRLCRRR